MRYKEENIEERSEEVALNHTMPNHSSNTQKLHELQAEIFPNPFSSITNIQFHLSETNDVALTITDINGKIVHQQQYLDVPSGWQQHQFDAGYLSGGIYFLHVRSAEQQVVKQLVLQK